MDLNLSALIPPHMKSYAYVSAVVPHLAHAEQWWSNSDDASYLLPTAPRRYQTFLVGDSNVEGRVEIQTEDDMDKWQYPDASLESLNLLPMMPR